MRIRNIFKSFLINLHRHKKSEPDVFIFSLPRAGSTLLAEVLNTDPHSKMASESLAMNKDNTHVLRKYFEKGFLGERYVDISDENFQGMIKYYADLSAGKTWNSYYWSDFFTPYHHLTTTRTIFKTHRVSYYFDDLMAHFKDDFGLYLLRNPVSHALSRLNKGWSTYLDLYAEALKIKDILPRKAELKIAQVKATGSDLEKYIVSWCLENYVFIRSYQEGRLASNIFAVFYEELVLNPENTIKDICLKVKMEYNENMLSIVDVPSSGIVHSTKETIDQIKAGNKNYLTDRWKESISIHTEKKVEDILTSFGISIYLE
ncbi:MAG: sulfotransferase [Bacteroidia bacterium]|nr:MAG: sulfotransferase [Bacteroidia bacterium]